ncbi:uncharacterized protein VTP21DRAFT_2549 [Calcarisporiella thermophila]|uniref:uncharacterized protein n=1 Tax=Calcarisporiella thermophila TaxID=911321 RepID=UPI00374453F3
MMTQQSASDPTSGLESTTSNTSLSSFGPGNHTRTDTSGSAESSTASHAQSSAASSSPSNKIEVEDVSKVANSDSKQIPASGTGSSAGTGSRSGMNTVSAAGQNTGVDKNTSLNKSPMGFRPMSEMAGLSVPNSSVNRPASDILYPHAPKGSSGYGSNSPEVLAINKWYENFQQYEKTIEDMAKASLDQTFKDELNAIDQWFGALSDAERTAALYTLMQYCNPVQIRFFITVLQDMARRDPVMGALLSPANPSGDSMQAQLASAMAKMDEQKTPSYRHPQQHQQQRHSMQPSYRTSRIYDRPTSALEDRDRYSYTPQGANITPSAHHVGDARHTHKQSVRMTEPPLMPARPKSACDFDAGMGLNFPPALETVAAAFSSRRSFALGGVNTIDKYGRPKSADISQHPMSARPKTYDRAGLEQHSRIRPKSSADLDAPSNSGVNSANWREPQQGITLDNNPQSWRRRKSYNPTSNAELKKQQSTATGGTLNIVLSNFDGDGTSDSLLDTLRHPTLSPKLRSSSRSRQGSRSPSPSRRPSAGSVIPPLSPRRPGSRGQYGNFLTASPGGEDEYLSDHSDISNLSSTTRRNKKVAPANNGEGGGAVDMTLVQDVPAWLRSLRLHKYTSNFEGLQWKDLVRLSDEELQAKGVAALGARRKMLKIFETVRTHCVENNITFE